MLSDIQTLWTLYNAEDSVLPLLCPLVLWVSSFLFCYIPSTKPHPTFHRWYTIHNIHNFGAILLGLVSMYLNDDSKFNERIPILWSIGYFIVDLVDCLCRRDAVYLAHAIFCLLLGGSNYTTPLSKQLRMNSKASLLELSNPLMHLAKKTRKPWHFATFALVFTACRIIWIPHLMMQLMNHGMEWTDPRILCCAAFYGLNVFWWIKILKILLDGLIRAPKDTDPKKME